MLNSPPAGLDPNTLAQQQQQQGGIPAGDVLLLLVHKDMVILQLQARVQQLEQQLQRGNGTGQTEAPALQGLGSG